MLVLALAQQQRGPSKGCEVPPAARDVALQLPSSHSPKSAGKGQSQSYPGPF